MLSAQVTPELRVAGDVPVESIAVLATRQSAVEQAVQAADALVSPVDILIAIVMLSHGDGIPAEVLRERFQAQLGLLAGGCMQRGVVQSDFESLVLKVLHPGAVGRLGARAAMIGGRAGTADRPHAFGGAEAKIGQEGVDLAAGLQSLRIRVVEDGEGERFSIGPQYSI